ncbi:MAG: hypothetical protein K8F26_12035 [Thiobacillus sp.]|jgi:hypothetical protein|nr:hypothetical protein [Thiobacillus sp.]
MNVTLYEKQIEIRLTAAAARALSQRATPLVAEMELLFSCLLRKRVYFGESMDHTTPVNDRLSVRFKPIMTRRCSVSEGGATPPSEGFPLENPRPFVPGWLAIDYRRGEWVGQFGYAE